MPGFRPRTRARALELRALCVLLCVLCATGHAQPCATSDGRPSVGLALSGGGARGAAHVGVLKVLESLRIPVDCIAGTSMGAIVGGLYAVGHSADDLEQIIASVDWGDAFRDDPSRDELSFRRRQDDYDLLVDFELGLRGGKVQLPRGLIQGQKLTLLLRRLTAGARHAATFDELPIAFRAVATDAVTGGAVILGRGELALAQRASMAAPGVFAPANVDGRLLIDGGISNNLPINVVRAMGADIVIAVDISAPLIPRDALNSAFALSNQALTILVRREAVRQLATLTPRDVAIVPDLGSYSSADFSQLGRAIELGYQAAHDKDAELARLALDDAAYAAWRRAHTAARDAHPPRIRSLVLEDDSRLSRETLATLLTLREGDPFDARELERDIARIYGLNIFEAVDYNVSGEDDVDIVIRTRQKSWGPNFLNFGLSLADDFERASPYSLGVRYTRTQVNPLGGEWRLDLQFGNNPLLRTEFYQPLSRTSRFFVAPRIDLSEFGGDLFADTGSILAEYRVRVREFGLDGGIALSNRAELRLGLSYVGARARLIVGDPLNENFSIDSGRLRLLYRYDSLDNTSFPTDGTRFDATVQGIRKGLGADRSRNRAALEWLGVNTFGNTHVLASTYLGSNFGGDGSVDDEFQLGGLLNLSGYRTGELRGQHAALLSLSAFRRIRFGDRVPLPVFAGFSLESGNVWNDTEDVDLGSLRFAGSVFIGATTPIGPAYLGYGLAEGGRTAAYFFLGQPFGASVR